MPTQHNKKGFTLIELLVVIAIISLLATFTLFSIENSKKKSRDSRRLADMAQIKKAIELFFDEQGRYPDSSDGISNSGQVIGEGDDIDTVLTPYLLNPPADPLDDGSTGANDYYYAYDPSHASCEPVISINRFESQATVDTYGYQAITSGGNLNMRTAHYNYCFTQ